MLVERKLWVAFVVRVCHRLGLGEARLSKEGECKEIDFKLEQPQAPAHPNHLARLILSILLKS